LEVEVQAVVIKVQVEGQGDTSQMELMTKL
jgi:hypothetical protein